VRSLCLIRQGIASSIRHRRRLKIVLALARYHRTDWEAEH
jgi:hypothetical protein